jgi:hypothetical protein
MKAKKEDVFMVEFKKKEVGRYLSVIIAKPKLIKE